MAQRIMIVDDNPDDIEITKIVMSELGRKEEITAMGQGKAALESLGHANGLPALILLDLKMPGMSGLDALRQIRADEHWKRIPVIIVTSSSLESDERDAYEAGASGFLHKDFNISVFREKLKVYLQRYLGN